ncbi:Swt1 family HEPN domain-containing protein [Candidatus Poriferisodalis sp.]|uniref:Swt1 family HEPN domain-containing protein n=1 Tax=Candidatus Poriferisodalis sp. TaxID=3101277 RepID=UPI003B029D44
MGDIAHEVWIGDGGKLVPARLRDTIKSYWPDSPDDSARDLLGKALELLGGSLRLLNEPRFRPAWGENWHEELCSRYSILGSHRFRVSPSDPYVHLKILQKERKAASALLGSEADQRLRNSLRARNQWAHFAGISGAQARDDVVEMIDLIAHGRMGAEADGLAVDNGRIDQNLARLENIRRALDFQISGH